MRHRLLVPAWIGAATMVITVALGARDIAEVIAYGLGAFATAGIVRQFYLGVRGRRRALGESGPQALGRAYAVEPASRTVAWSCTSASCSSRSRSRRRRRTARARPSASGSTNRRRSGATRSRTSGRTRTIRAEDDRLRWRACAEGRSRPRCLCAGGVHVPEQHRGHRDAVGANRPARRRLPDAGVVAERAGSGDARRPHQLDDRVAVDRRRGDGDRHGPRPAPEPAAPAAPTAGGRDAPESEPDAELEEVTA